MMTIDYLPDTGHGAEDHDEDHLPDTGHGAENHDEKDDHQRHACRVSSSWQPDRNFSKAKTNCILRARAAKFFFFFFIPGG